jgi:hypothetical protein
MFWPIFGTHQIIYDDQTQAGSLQNFVILFCIIMADRPTRQVLRKAD